MNPRRCTSCGNDLLGKPAYHVRNKFFCTTVRCLSKAYTENFHDLIPIEEEKLGEFIKQRRFLEQRRHVAVQSCGA